MVQTALKWHKIAIIGLGGLAAGYVGATMLAPDRTQEFQETIAQQTQQIPSWISKFSTQALEQMKQVSVSAAEAARTATEQMGQISATAMTTVQEASAAAMTTAQEVSATAMTTAQKISTGAIQAAQETMQTAADVVKTTVKTLPELVPKIPPFPEIKFPDFNFNFLDIPYKVPFNFNFPDVPTVTFPDLPKIPFPKIPTRFPEIPRTQIDLFPDIRASHAATVGGTMITIGAIATESVAGAAIGIPLLVGGLIGWATGWW